MSIGFPINSIFLNLLAFGIYFFTLVFINNILKQKEGLKKSKPEKLKIVEGKVQNISLAPDEKGNYYVDVILPKGLKTSYNKQLPFDKELKGNAEIVTQDLRLIERFFIKLGNC